MSKVVTPPDAVRTLLIVGLSLACVWLGVKLFWLVLSPWTGLDDKAKLARQPEFVEAQSASVDDLLNSPWFGGQSSVSAADGSFPPTSLAFKLRGVIAASKDRPAAAIIAGAGPREVAVAVGENIQSGVVLKEVRQDQIIIQNQGRMEKLMLDAKPATAIASVNSAPAGASPLGKPLQNQAGSEPSARLPISRNAVLKLVAQGATTLASGLQESSPSGVLVKAASPLQEALLLQGGDVLQQVNGMPVNRPSDISIVIGSFAQQSEVTLAVLRKGKPTTLIYQVQP